MSSDSASSSAMTTRHQTIWMLMFVASCFSAAGLTIAICEQNYLLALFHLAGVGCWVWNIVLYKQSHTQP